MNNYTKMQRQTRALRDSFAAILAAVLLGPLILGSTGGSDPEQAAGPPDAGTLLNEEMIADRHAPAGDGSAPKQTHVEVEVKKAKQMDERVTAEPTREKPMPPRELENRELFDHQEAKPPPPVAQAPSTPNLGTNAPPLHAEASPKPTAVEHQPKPVAQMTPEEIQRTVAEYRTWAFQGQIRLILEHSLVTPEQLHSVTALYALTQIDRSDKPVQQELVDSAGHFRDDLRGGLDEHMLTGDLHSEKQWPPLLTQKVLSAFGPRSMTRVKFYLSDACALRIYRVLAQEVGNKKLVPGAEFKLQLHLDPEGKIAVRLFTQPNF